MMARTEMLSSQHASNVAAKTVVLIDGSNLYFTARALRIEVDFKKLLAEFRSMGDVLRVKYYTALDEDAEYSSLIKLTDWLDYNGYTIVSKPLKHFDTADGNRMSKGNMDVEIAVDAMELPSRAQHLVLVSGDGDFRRVVEAVQRRGVFVTVVSTLMSKPSICADELRRQADAFIDLESLRGRISRDGVDQISQPAAVER